MILKIFGNKKFFEFSEINSDFRFKNMEPINLKSTIINSQVNKTNVNNEIYVDRLNNLFILIESDYQKRIKFKSKYKFVLTIEELEELEKINKI